MSVAAFATIVVVAFLLMEPVTAATHRWVMHGIGEWFHRSHHRPGRKPRWERNDWFPVFFAAIVLFGLWLGFNRNGFAALVPMAIGVTLYGAAYALVHDGFIHRRLDPFGDRTNAYLDHVADVASDPPSLQRCAVRNAGTGRTCRVASEGCSHRARSVRRRRHARRRRPGVGLPSDAWWIARGALLDSGRSQRDKAIAFRPPSSSGLGHHPFKVAARVRIPLGVRRVSVIHIWSRGEVWSSRRPVKPEVAGSSPVGTAAGGHLSSKDGEWLFCEIGRVARTRPVRSSSSVGRAHA